MQTTTDFNMYVYVECLGVFVLSYVDKE